MKDYFSSLGASSKTFFGLSHSKNPKVIHVGKTKPKRNDSTQNANPAISINIKSPNPLIIISRI